MHRLGLVDSKKVAKMFKVAFLFAALITLANGKDLSEKLELSQEDNNVIVDGSGEETNDENTLPNVGFLFSGYNIISGNPMDPNRFDPGFAEKIFKAQYTKGRRTDDRKYTIPDNADIIAKTACSDAVTVETIMTESEYQHDLSTKAAASISGKTEVAEASFTASAEYTRMSSQLKSNQKSIIKNEASCIVYGARIQTGTPPPVTDNFRAFVRKMAKKKNYADFLNTFGTHFVEFVDMGARFTKLDQMSKKIQEELQKNGFDIKLASEASIGEVGSASTSSEFSISTEDKQKYEKSVESSKIVTIGTRLPQDGNKETWRAEAIKTPMPIFYFLRSITELFNGEYFTIDGADVVEVGKRLSEALKGYCRVLKKDRFPHAECEGPPKDCGGGSQCSFNAICTDNSDSDNKDHLYNCVCKEGFKGDGKVCERELLGVPTQEMQQDDNRYDYGTWGGMDVCTNGEFAQGFTLRVAKEEGAGDDTAANAICITCDESEERCSKKGLWGDWSQPFKCPDGSYLTGWRQNVEANKGWGLLADDTGLNNVEYECRDLETWTETEKLKGNGYEWGSWSRFKRCPHGQFICGLNTRVAPFYYDDTALNDIIHKCCKPQFSSKKMARMLKLMASKKRTRKLKNNKKVKKVKKVKSSKGDKYI